MRTCGERSADRQDRAGAQRAVVVQAVGVDQHRADLAHRARVLALQKIHHAGLLGAGDQQQHGHEVFTFFIAGILRILVGTMSTWTFLIYNHPHHLSKYLAESSAYGRLPISSHTVLNGCF